jgi:molybdopterin/thiamine biosynthesis adenylyltransferase
MTAVPEIVIDKRDRYSRLRAIEWWDQPRLGQARVMVAGAGALGNEVLKNLALLGVGHILVVDFDTIEVTNLSRSILFRPGDETQPKAELAARRLREINPDIEVEALHGDVVWDIGLGRLRRFDVVLGCLDNREARLGLNRNCWRVGVPWIDGALGVMSGQVRIFVPPDSACYECGFTPQDYQELNLRYSCQLLAQEGALSGQVPTTPGSASIIAAMQVQEMLKMLHGQPVLAGHEIDYDGQHHTYRTIRLPWREDCLSHDPIRLDQVITLPDARATEMTGGQLLQRVRDDLGEQAYVLLDREVVTALVCPNGHGVDRQVRPQHVTGAQAARCPHCGQDRIVSLTHKITPGDHALAELPLAALGVPAGHILVGRYGRNQGYYELGGDV